MSETTSMVMIRAIRVHNYGNGIVGIEMPSVPMSDEDRQTLHRLFPMLTDEVYNLLNKEALLASLFHGPLPESITHDIVECNSPVGHMRGGIKQSKKNKPTYKNEDGEINYPSEEVLPPNSY